MLKPLVIQTEQVIATVNTAGDRNEWGRIDKRYTRHSLTGIPGANGKARFSHKPCCGIVGHGGKYYLPLRLAGLELEWTIVSQMAHCQL